MNEPVFGGIAYVEFYSGNAKHVARSLVRDWGFNPVAYMGLETGSRDKVSYVVAQGDVTLVISGKLQSGSEISTEVERHGDFVKKVALDTKSVAETYYHLVDQGIKSYSEPEILVDDNGHVEVAEVHQFGDTVHVLVDSNDYHGPFLPKYMAWNPGWEFESTGIQSIDHIVTNLDWNQMEIGVAYYRKFGFQEMSHFTDADIGTEYSALMSKVVQHGGGKIKMPINEPAKGRKKSQIEEFIEYHNSPGIQHIALSTNDILETVAHLQRNGVGFLRVPDEYYETLPRRVPQLDKPLQQISELGILVDAGRDEEGYLLQIFTKPIFDLPTFFIEIIQREGSAGFGLGNFRALFKAIELEQAKRGNL